MVNALRKCFRFPICIRIIELRRSLSATSHENGANFVFFSTPVSFRGHFEEIAIAKVLLNTKSRRVGEFRGSRFSDV